MKNFLSTLHRWLGFPLGLLFIITFGTGCLTAVDELLERFAHNRENAQYTYRSTTIEEDALAIATIIEGKPEIGQVLLPTQNTPYYQVMARGKNWTYAIDQLDQPIYSESNENEFFRTVLQLHRSFLLGKDGFLGIEGKHYAAWVGLLALSLSLLGLWLWWPLRKSFAAKDIIPRGKKRKHFYYSHMSSGVVVLVVILMLALTGASITYRELTQQLFGIEREKPPVIEPVTLNNDWQAWVQTAYAQMPEGARLEHIRFPRQEKGKRERQPTPNDSEQKRKNRDAKVSDDARNNTEQKKADQDNNKQQLLTFRFYAPSDWLGLTSSEVKIDKQASQLIDVVVFRNLSMAEKIYSILKPLHTGHHLPAIYVIVLLILSMIGTVMVFSGLLSFIIKKRKWLKSPSILLAKNNSGIIS